MQPIRRVWGLRSPWGKVSSSRRQAQLHAAQADSKCSHTAWPWPAEHRAQQGGAGQQTHHMKASDVAMFMGHPKWSARTRSMSSSPGVPARAMPLRREGKGQGGVRAQPAGVSAGERDSQLAVADSHLTACLAPSLPSIHPSQLAPTSDMPASRLLGSKSIPRGELLHTPPPAPAAQRRTLLCSTAQGTSRRTASCRLQAGQSRRGQGSSAQRGRAGGGD